MNEDYESREEMMDDYYPNYDENKPEMGRKIK